MSSDELVNTLQRLADVLQRERTLGSALASIAEAATVSVPRCDAASIALSVEGRPATAAVSARVALELDMVQYDTDDGPCLRAFRSMGSLRMDLVEAAEAFPHFAVAMGKRGVRGVLSLPATWGDEMVATLNLYSRVGVFDETAEAVAAVLAAQVVIAVSRSPEFALARAVVEEAQRSADDQGAVNVATGLLMVNEACTAAQAEGLLHHAAIQDEKTILEIAQRIIRQHEAST
jgi:hypothetical protein